MACATRTASHSSPKACGVLSEAEAKERLSEALAFYDNDRLLDASRSLNTLSARASPAFKAQMAASPHVMRVQADMAEVESIYATLGSSEGWITCYNGACTTVEYRQEPDKLSHTMRATGEIRAPLRNVAALLNEPDLFPALFWFVSRTHIVGQKGRFRRAADLTLYAPPPLSDREVCLYGFAVDALDNDDCVLIVSRDRRAEDGLDVPPTEETCRAKGTVRATVYYSMFELRPVSPKLTKVRLIANSDPKLSYIPMLLINWCSRTIMRFSLRTLEWRARNIDSLPHAQRLSKPIYRWIDSRLVAYWATKGFSETEALDLFHDTEDNASGEFDADTRPAPPSRSSILSALVPSSGRLRKMISRD